MSSCSPQFTLKDTQMDVLSELFSLLTKLWITLKNEEETKEVIESCSRLKGRVYVSKPNLEMPIRCLDVYYGPDIYFVSGHS
jgi:hypothetical protein